MLKPKLKLSTIFPYKKDQAFGTKLKRESGSQSTLKQQADAKNTTKSQRSKQTTQTFQKDKKFLNRRKKYFYKDFLNPTSKVESAHLEFRTQAPTTLYKLKGKVPWMMDGALSAERRSTLEGGRHSVS